MTRGADATNRTVWKADWQTKDHSDATGDGASRGTRRWTLYLASLALAASLGALSDIISWEDPPGLFTDGFTDGAAWVGRILYYGAIVALAVLSAWVVRRELQRRSALDDIRVSSRLESVDILVLGVSNWSPASSEPQEPEEYFAEQLDSLAPKESVESASARAERVFESMSARAGGGSWEIPLGLLADALNAGSLKALVVACSSTSAVAFRPFFAAHLGSLLKEAGVSTTIIDVEMMDVKKSFDALEIVLEDTQQAVGQNSRQRKAPKVIIDANAGPAPFSIAAALLSMKERQAFSYKERDKPRTIYDMKAARNSGLIPGADA